MKKIGFLVLALVLAFGALGVGYAGWIDSVWVNGTVNTGDVDIEIVSVSNTYAYKDLRDDSLMVSDVELFGAEYIPIASSTTEVVSCDPNVVTMTYDGIFPCVDFRCDFVVRSVGSIPVKVNVDFCEIRETTDMANPGYGKLAELWEMGIETMNDPTRYGAWVEAYTWEGEWLAVLDPETIQLHEEDELMVVLVIHLPQEQEYEALEDLTFEGYIQFIQWNAVGEEVEDPFDPFGWGQ
jgi:hypothetical protein